MSKSEEEIKKEEQQNCLGKSTKVFDIILAHNNQPSSSINLNEADFGNYEFQLFFSNLAKINVTKLNLNNCRLQADVLKNLSIMLVDNNTINILTMSKSKVGDNITLLNEGISKSKSLTSLDISGNNISDPINISSLVTSILLNKTITNLNMSDNHFGNKGTTIIAKELLSKSEVLSTLEINRVGMNNEGLRAITKVLTDSKLKTLEIEKNEFGYTGLQLLNKAIAESKHLTTVKSYQEELNLMDKQLLTNSTAFASANQSLNAPSIHESSDASIIGDSTTPTD